MIVGAAVCPGAPLLVAGLAPTLDMLAAGLSDSCAVAVSSLDGADRILLVTSGARGTDGPAPKPSVLHPPGTPVSSGLFTDSAAPAHFRGRLPGGDGPGQPDDEPAQAAALPGTGVVVGAALLSQAGLDIPTVAIELASVERGVHSDPVDPALDLLAAVRCSTDRVALLVIADGSASRGPDSPGGAHAEAEVLDAALAAALAAGNADALTAAATGEATGVLFTSGPAFAALARTAADTPPDTAALLYDDAPFGVGYLVATWSWA